MDGYIKNKKAAIREQRLTILYKYLCTFPILLFVALWLFFLVTEQPPEKWTHREILFSHISVEPLGRSRYPFLYAQDGKKYPITSKEAAGVVLTERLIPGERYTLVFSDGLMSVDYAEGLYDDDTVYLDLDTSIARWEERQKEYMDALKITAAIELGAILLIDWLWCSTEYSRIEKLKADIKRREERRTHRS